MNGLPTPAELAYARDRLHARRARTVTALVTGEHVDNVARMVFSYVEDDEAMHTPDEIAHDILTYVAKLVEPLLTGDDQ